MIQEILTYLVVAWAFYKVIIFFYRIFKPVKGSTICGSGGTCPSCDAKTQLFKDIKQGRFPTLMEDKIKV
ncbi:FeoB-associated Cys-rich membrane protein [Carboxylicivirga caseinilyticus]|uniref:FeoB-associated Cys-rich membrane protein n=1 Tax=Carboxylicivirga caseinilyticus TaxID=3417572 RepID=UPI003D34B62E|nr:FeoB-associated Cys-rich membrane protein [Marinilabiliaceae bacterium A049]